MTQKNTHKKIAMNPKSVLNQKERNWLTNAFEKFLNDENKKKLIFEKKSSIPCSIKQIEINYSNKTIIPIRSYKQLEINEFSK